MRQAWTSLLVVALVVTTAAAQYTPPPDNTISSTANCQLPRLGRFIDPVTPWEELVQRLDAARAQTGTFAARPAASAARCAQYLVTDCATTSCLAGGGTDDCWTVSNGTTWTTVTCSGAGGGGGGGDSFVTVQPPAGTNPVAEGVDTLVLTATNEPITITGTAGTDTLAFGLTLQSGSGLVKSGSGLTIRQDCATNDFLKWTGSWGCSPGGAGGSAWTTIDTPLGTDPMADTNADTLQLLSANNALTITGGDATPETVSFAVATETGGGLQTSGGLSLLRTCGTNEILKWTGTAWTCQADAGQSSSPGGSTTHVQYNNAGAFAGDSTFSFDQGANKRLNVSQLQLGAEANLFLRKSLNLTKAWDVVAPSSGGVLFKVIGAGEPYFGGLYSGFADGARLSFMYNENLTQFGEALTMRGADGAPGMMAFYHSDNAQWPILTYGGWSEGGRRNIPPTKPWAFYPAVGDTTRPQIEIGASYNNDFPILTVQTNDEWIKNPNKNNVLDAFSFDAAVACTTTARSICGTQIGNRHCYASGQPFGCCTGLGAGTCTGYGGRLSAMQCTASAGYRPWDGTVGNCENHSCVSNINEACGTGGFVCPDLSTPCTTDANCSGSVASHGSCPNQTTACTSNANCTGIGDGICRIGDGVCRPSGLQPNVRYFATFNYEHQNVGDMREPEALALARYSEVNCADCIDRGQTLTARQAFFDMPNSAPPATGWKVLAKFPRLCRGGNAWSVNKCAGSATTCTSSGDCSGGAWCEAVEKSCTADADCGTDCTTPGSCCRYHPNNAWRVKVYIPFGYDATETLTQYNNLFYRQKWFKVACTPGAGGDTYCDGGAGSCDTVTSQCKQTYIKQFPYFMEVPQIVQGAYTFGEQLVALYPPAAGNPLLALRRHSNYSDVLRILYGNNFNVGLRITNAFDLVANGSVFLGDGSTGGTVTLLPSSAPIPTASRGIIHFNGTKLRASENGGSFVDLVGGGGGGSPGSPVNSVQFNNAGSFGGDTDLIWNSTSNFLGINEANPGVPLNFAAALGDKVSFYGNVPASGLFGIGIQSATFQVFTSSSNQGIAFGHGSSGSFTETARVHTGDGLQVTAPTAGSPSVVGSRLLRLSAIASTDDPRVSVHSGGGQTTDATETTIEAWTCTAGKSYVFDAIVRGQVCTGASCVTVHEAAGYRVTAVGRCSNTNTAIVVQSTTTPLGEEDASWHATIGASGDNFLVRVTGAAGKTVTWTDILEVHDFN